jgi:hypothetical protein
MTIVTKRVTVIVYMILLLLLLIIIIYTLCQMKKITVTQKVTLVLNVWYIRVCAAEGGVIRVLLFIMIEEKVTATEGTLVLPATRNILDTCILSVIVIVSKACNILDTCILSVVSKTCNILDTCILLVIPTVCNILDTCILSMIIVCCGLRVGARVRRKCNNPHYTKPQHLMLIGRDPRRMPYWDSISNL